MIELDDEHLMMIEPINPINPIEDELTELAKNVLALSKPGCA
jgi:hypothetical protein